MCFDVLPHDFPLTPHEEDWSWHSMYGRRWRRGLINHLKRVKNGRSFHICLSEKSPPCALRGAALLCSLLAWGIVLAGYHCLLPFRDGSVTFFMRNTGLLLLCYYFGEVSCWLIKWSFFRILEVETTICMGRPMRWTGRSEIGGSGPSRSSPFTLLFSYCREANRRVDRVGRLCRSEIVGPYLSI